MSDQETVVKRLVAVATKLEAYAQKVASGGGGGDVKVEGGAKGSLEGLKQKMDECLEAYKHFPEFHDNICVEFPKVFNQFRLVVESSIDCKKPNDQILVQLLTPLRYEDKKKVSPHLHWQAFCELTAIFDWVGYPKAAFTPSENTVKQAAGASVGLINQTITKNKKEDEIPHNRKILQSVNAFVNALADFQRKFYPSGLQNWNDKGVDFSAKGGSAAPAAPTAPDAPAAPEAPTAPDAPSAPTSTASKGGGADDKGALFAAINAGGDKTATEAFGLKKVTKEMKKNVKDLPPLEPKKKEKAAEPKKEEKSEKKVLEPKKFFEKKAWNYHNYVGTPNNKLVEEVPLEAQSTSVRMHNCKHVVFVIKEKRHAIDMAESKRCEIHFDSLISTLSFRDCASVKAHCSETVPCVEIENSAEIDVHLSQQAVDANPDITTSKIQTCNIVVPPDPNNKMNPDPVEIALPMLYITKYDSKTRKITTVPAQI